MNNIDPNEEHAEALSEGYLDEDHRRAVKRELRAAAAQDEGERQYEEEATTEETV